MITLLFFLFTASAHAHPPGSLFKSPAPKQALIYKGEGVCEDGCAEAVADVAKRAGFTPKFVGPDAITNETPELERKNFFKNVSVWIQPGGWAANAAWAMTEELKDDLVSFVKEGGGYVGFCAGAFLSTKWVGQTRTYGFGFIPGSTIVFQGAFASPEIIPVSRPGKKNRHIYWEGGPYFELPENSVAEVMARYSDESIAAVRAPFGKGRAYVAGFHPEAPKDWSDEAHLTDPDGDDIGWAVEMVKWVVKKNGKRSFKLH